VWPEYNAMLRDARKFPDIPQSSLRKFVGGLARSLPSLSGF
jgi:hypothetical protein